MNNLAYGFIETKQEIYNLIKKASNKDITIFGNEYFAEAFATWNSIYKITSFNVDSFIIKSAYDEIWMSKKISSLTSDYKIALIVKKSKERKIEDIRRLLVTERDSFSETERSVLEFIEKFLWIYDIGIDNFIKDFLFLDYVKLRYGDITSLNNILVKLRSQFGNPLPIQSFSWENKDSIFIIHLVLDYSLKPLEIFLNIEKYLTLQFYENTDIFEQINCLKDSLKLWINKEETKADTIPYIYSNSSHQAIKIFLNRYMSDFNINILDTTNSTTRLEAFLPPIDGLAPLPLELELGAEKIDSTKYLIRSYWAKNHRPSSKMDSIYISKACIDKQIFSIIIQETIQRYIVSGLQFRIQPGMDLKQDTKGLLIIKNSDVDTIVWNGINAYKNIIDKLTNNKLVYYFLRGITCQKKEINITSYLFLKDKKLKFEHAIKIHDYYHLSNEKFQLQYIEMDIYPIVRLDNVRSLFLNSDSTIYKPKQD